MVQEEGRWCREREGGAGRGKMMLGEGRWGREREDDAGRGKMM